MSQTAPHNSRPTTDTAFDVELRAVSKAFQGDIAVETLNLTIRRGEFFSILGPSGCGKSTTLRMIAGFESPSKGEVFIRGQCVTQAPPYRRPVNTVFQSYALFSHLTVAENIGFGLKLQKLGRGEIDDRVKKSLQQVQLENLARRFPNQLSGGQQQRVALARALVNQPAVLLLDEPLGALDLKLRKEMQMELAHLHRSVGLTFVMVTHDQEEALSLSDRIAVMNQGRVEQIGTPQEIYNQPATPFVASFIGDTNLLHGRVEGFHPTMLWVTTHRGLKLKVKRPELGETPSSGPVILSVRPEKIWISEAPPTEPMNSCAGHLKEVMYLGTHMHYLVELETGDRLTVRQPAGTPPNPATPLYVSWAYDDCLALAAS